VTELTARADAALAAAIDWFLRSGIQNQDEAPETRGGVHAYYKSDAGEYSYLYSEITGYALTLLAHLHSNPVGGAHRGRVRTNAGLALDWLRGVARTEDLGAYRCRYELAASAFRPYRVCTFDNAMCLNGVTSWAEILDDAELRAEASSLAGFMTRMQNADGSFNVRTLGRENAIENTYATWSTQIGSFLSKGAIGLLNLHRLTQEDALADAARRACDLALRFQTDEGRFLTHLVERHTLQHPHMYTVEGLLAAGRYLQDTRYLDAALRGIDWSLGTQLEDGGFPSMVLGDGTRNTHQRMDIQAQVLRAALWARAAGYDPDMARVERGVEHLLRQQSTSDERALRGGFLYGFDPDGTPLPHANSWVTMFAIQALLAYGWAARGQAPDDVFLLV